MALDVKGLDSERTPVEGFVGRAGGRSTLACAANVGGVSNPGWKTRPSFHEEGPWGLSGLLAEGEGRGPISRRSQQNLVASWAGLNERLVP